MVYLLFHTNLKFYLPVLHVNRTFTDCTESAECTHCVGNPSPHQLYIKDVFTAHNSKIFAKNQFLVAACARNREFKIRRLRTTNYGWTSVVLRLL